MLYNALLNRSLISFSTTLVADAHRITHTKFCWCFCDLYVFNVVIISAFQIFYRGSWTGISNSNRYYQNGEGCTGEVICFTHQNHFEYINNHKVNALGNQLIFYNQLIFLTLFYWITKMIDTTNIQAYFIVAFCFFYILFTLSKYISRCFDSSKQRGSDYNTNTWPSFLNTRQSFRNFQPN